MSLTASEAAAHVGHVDTAKLNAATLAIDIGGTGIKAAVLDDRGGLLSQRLRVETPHPCPPDILIHTVLDLVKPLHSYDRVSIGFPGYVRDGLVFTAPNLDSERVWSRFPLTEALSAALDRPTRLMNDAEVQGLGLIRGRGIEVVLTLGTGMGSAIFLNGAQTPHLELGHHPIRRRMNYDEYIGNEARKRVGVGKWNKRVRKVIDLVASLTHYDTLYLGGGNAKYIRFTTPRDVLVVDNQAGVTGGVRLWSRDSQDADRVS